MTTKAIRKILDEKLENNDIHLIDEILSYLMVCSCCKRYDVVRVHYVSHCKHFNSKKNSCLRCSNDWKIHKLCYPCMKTIMLSHNSGKRGVLTCGEFLDRIK